MAKRFSPLLGMNPSPFRSKYLVKTAEQDEIAFPFIRSPKVISLAKYRRAQSRHLNYEKKIKGLRGWRGGAS